MVIIRDSTTPTASVCQNGLTNNLLSMLNSVVSLPVSANDPQSTTSQQQQRQILEVPPAFETNNSSSGVSGGTFSPNNTLSSQNSEEEGQQQQHQNLHDEERSNNSSSPDSAAIVGDRDMDDNMLDIRHEIDNEAYVMSCDYIFCKLRKCGFDWSTCPQLPEPSALRLAMRSLGEEYERRYKQYFDGMCDELPLTPSTAYPTFFAVADELFARNSITWSYIVALYSFGGALSAYCIRKNMPQLVPYVADWVALYTETRLSAWIADNGGWNGFLKYYEKRPQQKSWQSFKGVITGVGAFCGVLTVVVTLGAMLASKS